MASFRIIGNTNVPAEIESDGNNTEMLRWFKKHLEGIMSGAVPSNGVQVAYNQSLSFSDALGSGGQASALLIGSGLSGTVGGTIGLTAVTVSTGASDTATMTALATAINANTTVNLFAYATNALMSFTCATVIAGNKITVNGIQFTAVVAGGTASSANEFVLGASDTLTAVSLSNAINRHPALAAWVRAVNVAGVIYLGMTDAHTIESFVGISNPNGDTTFTIGVAKPTASARCMVFATVPGQIGNQIACAESGTGMTAATLGTAGYLGGGSGGQRSALTWLVRP